MYAPAAGHRSHAVITNDVPMIKPCPPLIAGSCAREGREPRQVRKEATVPAATLCRRGAWLSFDGQSRTEKFRDGRSSNSTSRTRAQMATRTLLGAGRT